LTAAAWWAFVPLAAPALAAGATLLARSPRTVARIAWACVAALWLLAALSVARPPAAWDALARWYGVLVLALGGLSLAASVPYLQAEHAHGAVDDRAFRRYFSLFEAFVLSLVAIAALPNYLALWAAVEATTLTSVVLVAFPGGPRPLEAAWKYAVVTGAGGLLALLGTVLVLHGAGIPLDTWTLGAAGRPHPSAQAAIALEVGLLLAVVGYGSKAGLVPFHTWLPDAHSEAPAPVSALLSGVKLAGGLYALLRLGGVVGHALGPAWPETLLRVTGLLSLALAAAAVPGQRDLKRLFAYSSIEHMGVISLGASFGGVGLLGALLHMWTHAFAKVALFYGSGHVRLRYESTGAPRVRGLLAAMPWTASGLVLAAVAVVGVPPFGLFWSEWLVLLGGVRAGQLAWVAVALVFLVVNFLGFGLRLPDLVLGAPPADVLAHRAEPERGIWPLGLALLGVLGLGLVLPAGWHGTWLAAARLLAGGGAR
jgi:hydrogenase-4 component F